MNSISTLAHLFVPFLFCPLFQPIRLLQGTISLFYLCFVPSSNPFGSFGEQFLYSSSVLSPLPALSAPSGNNFFILPLFCPLFQPFRLLRGTISLFFLCFVHLARISTHHTSSRHILQVSFFPSPSRHPFQHCCSGQPRRAVPARKPHQCSPH